MAVRLLTKHGVGGVLDPEAEAQTGPFGKSVYGVLKVKHPVQRSPDASAFLE